MENVNEGFPAKKEGRAVQIKIGNRFGGGGGVVALNTTHGCHASSLCARAHCETRLLEPGWVHYSVLVTPTG